MSTTHLHDVLVFALHDMLTVTHDTLMFAPTTHLHDVLVFELHDMLTVTHDIHMFVSTTHLHDILVLASHDILTDTHDIVARHAVHDMVSPRHANCSPRHAKNHVVGACSSMSWRFSSMSC